MFESRSRIGGEKITPQSEDLRLFLTYMGRVTIFSLCGRPSLPVPALTLLCSKLRSVLRRDLTPWNVLSQCGLFMCTAWCRKGVTMHISAE